MAISIVRSCVFIFMARVQQKSQTSCAPAVSGSALAAGAVPVPRRAAAPRDVDAASAPRWLTIPERRLYTGIANLAAVGTGKTSACMYPYVEQMLVYRAADLSPKVAALEVKGAVRAGARDLGRGTGLETSIAIDFRTRFICVLLTLHRPPMRCCAW